MMKTSHAIEPLEARIAPASVAYTDIDGDLVTITASTGPLDAGDLVFTDGNPDGQLGTLTLTDPLFVGANVTFSVTKKPGGDGLAHVGYINATGVDLGSVTVKGDLGRIDAGDGNVDRPALKALAVQSLGRFGLNTQGGAGDLVSTIAGRLGALVVKGDFIAARVETTGGADGSIGAITIGGSLIGGGTLRSGTIETSGDMGPVRIGRDLLGGRGDDSGKLLSHGRLASLTIGGSLIGGAGGYTLVIDDRGQVHSDGEMGPVKIGRDVIGGPSQVSGSIISLGQLAALTIGGSLVGGLGFDSGLVEAATGIGAIKIGGNLEGGFGSRSGRIANSGTGLLASVTIGGSIIAGSSIIAGELFSGGSIGPVKIGGDVIGSQGGFGSITAIQDIASVTIGGSLIGGAVGSNSGRIGAGGDLGPVKVGRDVIGGAGATSAQIAAVQTVASVTIGGSLIGGAGLESASIHADEAIGPVKIGREVVGGVGASSAQIAAVQTIASVTIGGSLIGGGGTESASLRAGTAIGAVKIGGNLQGGSSARTGSIFDVSGGAAGTLASLTIGGSVRGGSATTTGAILLEGAIGAVKIGRNLEGGSISSGALDQSGYLQGARIASVFIGGSVLAGFDTSGSGDLTHNASIRAFDDLGAITIKGSVVGNEQSGGLTQVIISARGQETLAPNAKSDLAIKSLTIGGHVALALVLGGFEPDDAITAGSNGNASIGAVSIGGDWLASSISAGINADGFGFGNAGGVIDNPPGAAADAIVARIASIAIKGVLVGPAEPLFLTGFTAQQIGSFKAAGFVAPLTAATDPLIALTPYGINVTLAEVST